MLGGLVDRARLGEVHMVERLLTPSKITAWLDCAHYLTLKHEVEAGVRPEPSQPFGSFADLLRQKGEEHEAACLAEYSAQGKTVHSVAPRDIAGRETFATWAERVRPALDSEVDVLFQMPFVHDGIRGIADFLERTIDPTSGTTTWEPVDAKLARNEAKRGHVLQLCFYADAIAATTGTQPSQLKIWLGSRRIEAISYEAVRPYWHRLRNQLREVLGADVDPTVDAATHPEPCDHCRFCEFDPTCRDIWEQEDSLIHVAGIRRTDREALEPAGVTTLGALATGSHEVADMKADRLSRLQVQAQLQVQAKAEAHDPAPPPPFQPIIPVDDSPWGHGFEQLPEPHHADLFLDFEGHPFWRADRGLFFLFGYIASDDGGASWAFHQRWAHSEAEERDQVRDLVHYIEARRRAHPGMHVYHYNHTERSALAALAAEHAVVEGTLSELIDDGVFVDLMTVAKNAVQVGVRSYGLKQLEHLAAYKRSHDIDKGAGAVIAFDRYCHDRDEAHLASIAAYNEDDVRATKALRDWLVTQRPADLAWRALAEDDPDEPVDPSEIDELLERLASSEEGSIEHLLADLLGYWGREWSAYIAPIIGTLSSESDLLLDNPEVIAGLSDAEPVERLTPTGKPSSVPGRRLTFPPQKLSNDFTNRPPKKAIFVAPDGKVTFIGIDPIDVDARELVLQWNDAADERGIVPSAVVADKWFDISSKLSALVSLTKQVLEPTAHGAPNPATLTLLRADPPAFVPGGGPHGGSFTDHVDDLARWVTQLDASVLGIQGPPGTGKTYRGAHIAKALVQQGKRVGVTAMSHHAIGNLLAEIAEVFAEEPVVSLNAIRKQDHPSEPIAGVTTTKKNSDLAKSEFNIVAATSWGFAGKDMLGAPVDVLLIDEAGQLALIDAVVSSRSAHNVVLLGDPQQLPQVAQATHPRQSGHSALGHILGDHATMPPDRGVFINETRRMHPDVCRFISERIYDGKLTSHLDCADQGTALGTGLRWLQVHHTGCSTESEIEADAVIAQIHEVLGRQWTDKKGEHRTISAGDVMVVAPYNDQKDLLRAKLDADPVTKGLRVGTVDKFQGRQAPIVFFTMTSSSADDMPRGTEFLFSSNRLNVAISRAQCLAYLVCTKELLESRAKTVEDMLLIANLCAFVERTEA
jgi:predicted RecB family nuclease